MCGIIGGTHSDPGAAESLGLTMLEQIRYRGPDGGYLHVEPNFFLGMRRLAIINVDHGRQPVTSEDGQVIAVFNGEIYNHMDLRRELTGYGYEVQDGSDAEVIPHAYQKWGSDFPSRFNGDFAIALFDKAKKQWILARDRLGIKPLYYTTCSDELLFASEVKALFSKNDVPRQLNQTYLSQLFTYWTGLDGASPFEGVEQVQAGTVMRLTQSGKVIASHKYWDIPFSESVDSFQGDFETCKEAFRDEFNKSVALRLQADVEVGTYTSGGVDSSVVNVAAHKDLRHEQTQTFSVAFEDAVFDESKYQRTMADQLKLTSHELRCKYSDIYSNIEAVVTHTESPIFRTAPVPMFLLSKCVSENDVKVVLTGEGSDEVAWGYDIFREAKIRRFWSRQPDSKARPQLFQKLYAYLPQFQNKRHFQLLVDFFRQDMQRTDDPLYSHHMRIANSRSMRTFLSRDMQNQIEQAPPEQSLVDSLPGDFGRRSLLEKCQFLEMRTLLHGYLLSSQGDRMLSAHGVEGRFPFLDHHVIEFLAGIPENFRLRGMQDKAILRESYRADLPPEIFSRPKFAFRAPELNAFVEDKDGLVAELLSQERIAQSGIFDTEAVKRFRYRMKNTPAGRFTTRDNLAFVQMLSTQILFDKYCVGFRASVPRSLGNDVVVTRANELSTWNKAA